MKLSFLIGLVGVCICGAGQLTPAVSAASPICTGRFPLIRGGSVQEIPVCANKSWSAPDSTITRIIIVIHGDGRSAPDSLAYIQTAAASVGSTDTLILAPQLLIYDDIVQNALPSTIPYWTPGGWKMGDDSLTSPLSRPFAVSSYAMLDALVSDVADKARFPALQQISIVGHSAGGQLTNRYAGGNHILSQITTLGIRLRYIVASPSSYVYLSPDRRVGSSTTQFAPLSTAEQAACPGYDTYTYGLSGLNPYMTGSGEVPIRAQYRSSTVLYLLGGADADPHDGSLDPTCPAQHQGSQRLERGITYYNYLSYIYGPSIYTTHTKSVVDGVGHDSHAIFNSAESKAYLFDISPTLTPSPTPSPSPTPPVCLKQTCTTKKYGDADCDGAINILDLATYVRIVNGYISLFLHGYAEDADFNCDTETGLKDRKILIDRLAF